MKERIYWGLNFETRWLLPEFSFGDSSIRIKLLGFEAYITYPCEEWSEYGFGLLFAGQGFSVSGWNCWRVKENYGDFWEEAKRPDEN